MKTNTVILFAAALAALARADTLTLTTGEILNGEIIAETPTEYRLRTANANYTITSVRLVPKADVKAAQRDTPEQKQRRAAYENLCRYNLNPHQEYTDVYYCQVLAYIEKYVAAYPDDTAVRAKLADWNTELAQVTKGLVKYNNRWMTAAEKTAAITLATEQARLAAVHKNLAAHTQRLADLQTRRDNLTRDIALTTTALREADAAYADLRDFVEPIYEYRPSGGYPYAISGRHGSMVWSPLNWERIMVGERVTQHPLRNHHAQEVIAQRARLDRLQASLEQTERDITAARADLEKAQAALATK